MKTLPLQRPGRFQRWQTVPLVEILKRLERRVCPQRQREHLIGAIRQELEVRASVRATQMGLGSIHAVSEVAA